MNDLPSREYMLMLLQILVVVFVSDDVATVPICSLHLPRILLWSVGRVLAFCAMNLTVPICSLIQLITQIFESLSAMASSMQGITFGTPAPFTVPEWDYEPVRAIIRATDLSQFYNNLLDDAFERDEEDFTYGLSARVIRRLHEAAKTFELKPWAEKIRKMGDHHKLKVSGIQDQDDIEVHFIHRKCSKPDAINLLLVHGWPGSIIEFEQICHLLADRYNVVMPSIPGFAFSGTPKRAAKTKGGVPWSKKGCVAIMSG